MLLIQTRIKTDLYAPTKMPSNEPQLAAGGSPDQKHLASNRGGVPPIPNRPQDAKDDDLEEECHDEEIQHEDPTPEEPVDNTPEETKATMPTQEQIVEKIEIEEITKKQPKTRKRKTGA